MAVRRIGAIEFTDAGITQAIDVSPLLLLDYYALTPDVSTPTMAGDIIITFTGTPIEGSMTYIGLSPVIIGANTYTINGVTINSTVALKGGVISLLYSSGSWSFDYAPNFGADSKVSGAVLTDNSVALVKLTGLTSAQFILGNGSNVPTAVSMSGDISMTNAGVTAIGAGVIVDADVNASAAITRSKLAAGTAAQVVINAAGTGLFSSEAQLSALRGGNGIDNSAANGFVQWAAGVQSVAAITEVRHIDNLSFVTANQGTYYVYFPFPCTVTNINVRVTSVVSGTDVGELEIANNAGTVMTGDNLTAGVLEIASGAAFGTGYASTLETNNTFTAGQEMRLTTSKTTTGGVISADITYTRLTLS